MNLKPILRLGLTLVLLTAAAASHGQEQTGKLIEKLVISVDEQLTALELQMEKAAPEKERLKSALVAQSKAYDEATNRVVKAAVRGDLINLYSQLNGQDRAEVAGTLKTVVQVSETLRKMEAALEKSAGAGATSQQEQQARVAAFVQSTARLVKAVDQMEAATGKSNSATSSTLKNTLVMLNQQAKDNGTGIGGALARVKSTARALEDITVQLHLIHSTLENERNSLLAATSVQTIDLPLLRLAQARLGADSVVDIPMNKSAEIFERLKASWKQVADPGTTILGAAQSTDSLAFDQLLTDDLVGGK